jgi:uncharacterized protein (DUF924 family)
MMRADDVIEFWVGEVGPDRWYARDAALDAEIGARFGALVADARACKLAAWALHARPALALLILLDQFPRNIYRGRREAFASDRKAVAVAKRAIMQGHDLKVAEPERQFFYLPLMHSESQMDQDRCVRMILTRMPETGSANLPFALEHRDVIRRFGRFPYRNAALGRVDTAEEAHWLAQSQAA